MNDDRVATRRDFLRGGLTLVRAAATVPVFLDRTAAALARPAGRGAKTGKRATSNDRILVVLQLAGGNDGLNTIIPYRNDVYYRARPQLGIAMGQSLALTDEIGLHPAATGLKQLYDDGVLAIVQGV